MNKTNTFSKNQKNTKHSSFLISTSQIEYQTFTSRRSLAETQPRFNIHASIHYAQHHRNAQHLDDVRSMRNNFRAENEPARNYFHLALGVEANQLFKRAREAPKPKPRGGGGAQPPGARGEGPRGPINQGPIQWRICLPPRTHRLSGAISLRLIRFGR